MEKYLLEWILNCQRIIESIRLSFINPAKYVSIFSVSRSSYIINKSLRVLIILVIFSNCKETENPYIPTPDIFNRNFTENIPKKSEIELELREILNTENKFCDSSFQNKKIEMSGDNDNIFVSDTDQFTSSAYLSIFRQKIKDKSDIFIIKSRCCPMGPCYTSFFFQKQADGKWKLFDTIPGEVIDYKKTKDHTIVKIEDNILTGLTYIGFWKNNQFEPIFSYRHMTVEIPLAFSTIRKVLNEDKEINLLKRPKDYHIDNLAFRVKVLAGSEFYILNESEKHFFILLKATQTQKNDILDYFNGDREYLIEQIQGLNSTIKKKSDLEKLLDKNFYNIGWAEKF